jgi:hypothetical protein
MTMSTVMSRMILVVAMGFVMGLGACGGEGLPLGADDTTATAGDASGAADATPVVVTPAAHIEGCWVSAETGAAMDLLVGGAFSLVLTNGEDSKGTWTSDGTTYLSFFFPSGAPQATWRLSLAASSLTLSSGDGVATPTGAGLTTWTFVRSAAADCAR